MSLQKAMVSSKSNEWATPQWLFDQLDSEFCFTLDPCATGENAKCDRFYTREQNGLTFDWSNEVVFMNPPYGGNTGKWLAKAWHESLRSATVVCLIVASTDRSYWHDYIFPHATEIRWLRGRITFGEADSTAPFASAIIIFSDKRKGQLQKQQYYKQKVATWQYVMV